jgi:hypothetical protein
MNKNVTQEDIVLLSTLSNAVSQAQAALQVAIADIRTRCNALPGYGLDLETGEWKRNASQMPPQN